jgi:hypothetical protein
MVYTASMVYAASMVYTASMTFLINDEACRSTSTACEQR